MLRFISFVLLSFLSVDFSEQFPQGSPPSRCTSLEPSHQGAASQPFPSPYEITISKSVIGNGGNLRVEIRSLDPARTFAGFILQARTVTDPFVLGGSFIRNESPFNFVSCEGFQSTVTNSNNTRHESLVFEWTAPSEYIGKIRFHATVVESYQVFWVNQQSPEFEVIHADLPPAEELPEDDFYEGCDVSKTCFGIGGANCVANRQCVTVGAVIHDAGKFIFEMRASPAANYVGFALSDDRFMGRDSVIECVRQGQTVTAYTSFTNVIGVESSPRIVDQSIIRLIKSSNVNGRIYCQVERNAISNVEGMLFNLIDDKHYLLLASGTPLNLDSVGMHNIDSAASSVPILLTEVSVVRESSRTMLFLHACFMIVAWIMLTSIGIFTARFMKKTWVDVKIFGKDFWFMTHQVVMCLTWILTLSGFIIILVDSNRFSVNPHSMLGIITFSLCMIQPFGALFRPGPKDSARPIFNFLHLSAGNFCHLLSVITMFYAVNLHRAQLSNTFTFILIAYATTYVTFYTSMTVLGFFSDMRADNLSESTNGLTAKSNFDAPFSVLRKSLYIVFVLLSVLFAAALITVTLSGTL